MVWHIFDTLTSHQTLIVIALPNLMIMNGMLNPFLLDPVQLKAEINCCYLVQNMKAMVQGISLNMCSQRLN